MQNVVVTIQEIQSRLEREVEWPLTDHIDSATVHKHMRVINASLMELRYLSYRVKETA